MSQNPDVSQDPDAELVYDLYRQGHQRLEVGDAVGAAEVLELAAEREPGKASLHEALGRAYFASSRVARARGAFVRALELDPTDHYAHFGVGRCYEREGRRAEAATYYKLANVLAPKPDYADALARVTPEPRPPGAHQRGRRRGGGTPG